VYYCKSANLQHDEDASGVLGKYASLYLEGAYLEICFGATPVK